VWHEIVLGPGDQYTIPSMTEHWFHAPDGAVASEFSTQSRDEYDVLPTHRSSVCRTAPEEGDRAT
jgi:D-lyxose ketol-isomerase